MEAKKVIKEFMKQSYLPSTPGTSIVPPGSGKWLHERPLKPGQRPGQTTEKEFAKPGEIVHQLDEKGKWVKLPYLKVPQE
jgi:hypothetical protein